MIPDFLKKLNWGMHIEAQTVSLDMSNKLDRHYHCDGSVSLVGKPLIVPPTWNKGRFHQQLSPVWKAAAAHLAEAENVFVIGYSLPVTDEFFRYFYALSSVGESVFDTFCVVDKDEGVAGRFRRILGPSAEQHFTFLQSPFEDVIAELRGRLGVPSARHVT